VPNGTPAELADIFEAFDVSATYDKREGAATPLPLPPSPRAGPRVRQRLFGTDRFRLRTLLLETGRKRTVSILPDRGILDLVGVPGRPPVQTERRAPERPWLGPRPTQDLTTEIGRCQRKGEGPESRPPSGVRSGASFLLLGGTVFLARHLVDAACAGARGTRSYPAAMAVPGGRRVHRPRCLSPVRQGAVGNA
jgi:hypothetical protein